MPTYAEAVATGAAVVASYAAILATINTYVAVRAARRTQPDVRLEARLAEPQSGDGKCSSSIQLTNRGGQAVEVTEVGIVWGRTLIVIDGHDDPSMGWGPRLPHTLQGKSSKRWLSSINRPVEVTEGDEPVAKATIAHDQRHWWEWRLWREPRTGLTELTKPMGRGKYVRAVARTDDPTDPAADI